MKNISKKTKEENLDDAFQRLTKFRNSDIESIEFKIDEINYNKFSVKGIHLSFSTLSMLLILTLICTFTIFYC